MELESSDTLMKANAFSINLLPKKSRYRYERQYDRLTGKIGATQINIIF